MLRLVKVAGGGVVIGGGGVLRGGWARFGRAGGEGFGAIELRGGRQAKDR
jgi:hypothetical protein